MIEILGVRDGMVVVVATICVASLPREPLPSWLADQFRVLPPVADPERN